MSVEDVAAYDGCRRRLAGLVAAGDPSVPVPACPGWSVHDLVAHLAGLAGDVVEGRVDGYGTPPWTAAQVAAGRGRPTAELLARWEALMPAFATAVADPARSAGTVAPLPLLVLFDVAAHEADARAALGAGGAVDPATVARCLALSIGSLRLAASAAGAPPLRVVATGLRSWDVGRGEDPDEVEAEPFELWRALGGRRTRDEVAALRWRGDPGPHLDGWLLPPMGWPDRPVGP